MKKALFIGGTGTISAAITRRVAADKEWQLYLINRGNRSEAIPEGVNLIQLDINNEAEAAKALKGMKFDCVCDFIGFVPEQVKRDWRLFKDKTKQYMYISSASAYQKPCMSPYINEGTPLANPYWQYSRDKIECEKFLMEKYREKGFPVTIIRPSHTYDERKVPLGVHGSEGSWQVIKRMQEGKRVIVQGDGTSLWTMTHNSDFAKAFVGLMGNVHAIGNAFQITSDETLTWNQIYTAIANALGVEFKPYYVASDFLAAVGPQYDFMGSLIGDKSSSVIFDNTKVKRAVPEFNCTVHFEDGIRRTIENVLAHPELQKEDPDFDAWCDRVIEVLENARKTF